METLRMHPPILGVAKEALPEGLDVGGYYIHPRWSSSHSKDALFFFEQYLHTGKDK